MLGRLCLLLLALTALPAAAQLPLTAEQEHIFSSLFEGSGSKGELKCKVDEIKPFLDFGFRFEAGFVASCPINEFSGKQATVGTLLRIKTGNRTGNQRPTMLGQSFTVPGMSPELRRKINVRHLHDEIEFSGVFAAGEGDYEVELAIFDNQRRVHKKSWKIRAEAHGKEREASFSMRASSVSAITFPAWAGTSDDGKGLHLTILLDAAPMNPNSMHLRAWDRAFLLGSLSSLLRHLPLASVKLVAFNLEQQQELFRDDDFDRTGFYRLSEALNKLELGTISYKKLERSFGWEDLLTGLVRAEAEAPKPPDAVVLLGPTNRINQRIPDEFLEPLRNAQLPFFYFEYYPMHGREFPDAIERVTNVRNGKTYRLYSPGDLAQAITKMEKALARSDPGVRMTQ